MSRIRKGMPLIHVIEAVDRALDRYSSDNVDVIINELTGMYDVIYHSDNNSFAIESSVTDPDFLTDDEIRILIKELDRRGVGYNW